MRNDMNKVLVERPRIGHGKKFREVRHNKKFNDDVSMHRESMRFRYKITGDTKQLNENLSPLYRWLDSKIGKRWDDVYSELRSTFNVDKTINDHIMIHVHQHVVKSTYTEDGKVFDTDCKYSYGRDHNELSNNQIYVDADGIIRIYRKVKPPRVSYTVIEKQHREAQHGKRIGNRWIRRIDGVWFIADLVVQQYIEEREPVRNAAGEITGYKTYYRPRFNPKFQLERYDRSTINRVWKLPEREQIGYMNVKQCNHAELKRYNLENDVNIKKWVRRSNIFEQRTFANFQEKGYRYD